VCTDIIRRILTNYFHYDINFAMGITDVDDKIINKAQSLGLSTLEEVNTRICRTLEADFFADMDALGVARPDAVLRVSEHMPEIVEYITNIQKQGFAYPAADGVYFDVNKQKETYGKLGNIPPASAAETVDVDNDSSAGKP
jgi:cysteinyl-tRNA synthetase